MAYLLILSALVAGAFAGELLGRPYGYYGYPGYGVDGVYPGVAAAGVAKAGAYPGYAGAAGVAAAGYPGNGYGYGKGVFYPEYNYGLVRDDFYKGLGFGGIYPAYDRVYPGYGYGKDGVAAVGVAKTFAPAASAVGVAKAGIAGVVGGYGAGFDGLGFGNNFGYGKKY